MRRSLLLIKPILLGTILSISHCPKSGAKEAESNATKDSLMNAQLNRTKDSLLHVGADTTRPIRIEHGSDNPAKLDSIKNAKGKKKN
ncbi:MAG: hypothetical protein IPP15_10355 [Saprospiraceae bacterium]|uniref:Uncharacterized protein n=1 Tax=Candidatus Opimibacter skivensis TaxID=2982028 RepID=A0A9D7SW61_9BACT|nr:hypothetical protein [Candidatus Opimibacter skivensis]